MEMIPLRCDKLLISTMRIKQQLTGRYISFACRGFARRL